MNCIPVKLSIYRLPRTGLGLKFVLEFVIEATNSGYLIMLIIHFVDIFFNQ